MNNKVGLKRFWQERFSTDNLYEWFDEFRNDIASVASEVSIDWNKTDKSKIAAGKILKSNAIAHTDKRRRHSLIVNWQKARNDITYPVITFISLLDGKQTWNGYAALLELFEYEGGQALSDFEREKREAERARKAAKQAADRAEAERLAIEAEQQIETCRNLYQNYWQTGETSSEIIAQNPYLIEKGVTSAVIQASSQMGHNLSIASGIEEEWRHGKRVQVHNTWLAVPMFNFAGLYMGHQRIYSIEKDGEFKHSKRHARGSQTKGSHLIIGDINEAETIDYVEGYATGASAYKSAIAENRTCGYAVIVCFDKDNLEPVIRHYKQRFSAKKHRVRADNDVKTFIKGESNPGLLAALAINKKLNVPVSYPDFNDLPNANALSDFNDLEAVAGPGELAKQLWGRKGGSLKAEKNAFEYQLQRLRLSGRHSWLKIAKAAVGAGAFFIPTEMTRREVLNLVFDAIPNTFNPKTNDKKAVARFLKWVCERRLRDADASKNFSPEILKQDNVNYIPIKGIKNEKGHPEIPETVLELVRALKGPTILKAAHGVGKTKVVIGPLMRDVQGSAGMVVHRVTLANQMANELNLSHYKEMSANVQWNDRFVVCLNSMIQGTFSHYWDKSELLCIDEATQVIRHNFAGDEAIHAPIHCYNTLLKAARNAERLLLTDADANDSLIEFLEQARPNETINIIEVNFDPIDLVINHCDSGDFVFNRIMETAKTQAAADKKERILVATDSLEKANQVCEGISKYWPEARVLNMTRETKGGQEQIDFSDDPNKKAADYDVLIYSPVISSGVSITKKESSFDHHFAIFSGVVMPSDIMQMIRRDRNAKSFLVALEPRHGSKITDRDALFNGLLKAYQASSSELNWSHEDSMITVQKTPFDEMYLSLKIQENRARNDYVNHTLMLMAIEGWELSKVDVDETEAAIGQLDRSACKEAYNQRQINYVLGETTPTEEVAKNIQRKELRTPAENAQLKRYYIESQLGADVNEDSIAFFDDRGISRLKRLEMAQATREQACDVDAWDDQRDVVFTRRRLSVARWEMVNAVFTTLGIDPKTGEGQFSNKEAAELLKYFTSSQDQIDIYNALNLGPQMTTKPACATRFAKGILERICPVVNGKKLRGVQYYQFQGEKFGKLLAYLASRQAIGQNHMIVDPSAELKDQTQTDSLTMFAQAKTPEAAPLLGHSEGGEIITEYINTIVKTPPHIKGMLIQLWNNLKPESTTPQTFSEAPLPVLKLRETGRLNVDNLLRLARGWLDPRCEDVTWGDVQPLLAGEV